MKDTKKELDEDVEKSEENNNGAVESKLENNNTVVEEETIPEGEKIEPIPEVPPEESELKREWGRFYGVVIKSLTDDEVAELRKRLKKERKTFKELVLQLIRNWLFPPPMSVQQVTDALNQALMIQDQLKKMGFGGMMFDVNALDKMLGEKKEDESMNFMKPLMQTLADLMKTQLEMSLAEMKRQMKAKMMQQRLQEVESEEQGLDQKQ